jgi:hypothetical protein
MRLLTLLFSSLLLATACDAAESDFPNETWVFNITCTLDGKITLVTQALNFQPLNERVIAYQQYNANPEHNNAMIVLAQNEHCDVTTGQARR